MNELRTVVVAGASGFIGQYLVRDLRRQGIGVRTIGREGLADARWDDPPALRRVLDRSELLVNLAGRSVGCRYTKRTVDEIFSSRTETTAALGRALAQIPDPPELWVNASTGTIYRDARDRPQDEATGELGSGLSVAVARAHVEISGPVNAATPEATTNTELMRALRAAVGAPLGLPNPVWLLDLTWLTSA